MASLTAKGLVRSAFSPVKVLGNGSLSKSLNVRVSHVSEAARRSVVDAGGTVS